MAEAVGLAASILGIATAGAKVATALTKFSISYAGSTKKLESIASRASLTATILQAIGNTVEANSALFKTAEFLSTWSEVLRAASGSYERLEAGLEKARGPGRKLYGQGTWKRFCWALGGEERVGELEQELEGACQRVLMMQQVVQWRVLGGIVPTSKEVEEKRELREQLAWIVKGLAESGLIRIERPAERSISPNSNRRLRRGRMMPSGTSDGTITTECNSAGASIPSSRSITPPERTASTPKTFTQQGRSLMPDSADCASESIPSVMMKSAPTVGITQREDTKISEGNYNRGEDLMTALNKATIHMADKVEVSEKKSLAPTDLDESLSVNFTAEGAPLPSFKKKRFMAMNNVFGVPKTSTNFEQATASNPRMSKSATIQSPAQLNLSLIETNSSRNQAHRQVSQSSLSSRPAPPLLLDPPAIFEAFYCIPNIFQFDQGEGSLLLVQPESDYLLVKLDFGVNAYVDEQITRLKTKKSLALDKRRLERRLGLFPLAAVKKLESLLSTWNSEEIFSPWHIAVVEELGFDATGVLLEKTATRSEEMLALLVIFQKILDVPETSQAALDRDVSIAERGTKERLKEDDWKGLEGLKALHKELSPVSKLIVSPSLNSSRMESEGYYDDSDFELDEPFRRASSARSSGAAAKAKAEELREKRKRLTRSEESSRRANLQFPGGASIAMTLNNSGYHDISPDSSQPLDQKELNATRSISAAGEEIHFLQVDTYKPSSPNSADIPKVYVAKPRRGRYSSSFGKAYSKLASANLLEPYKITDDLTGGDVGGVINKLTEADAEAILNSFLDTFSVPVEK